MPYHWTTQPKAATQTLELWPHNSLPAKGFAVMILGFFTTATIPLYMVIGTKVLWGLLPFVLAATGALYWGLQRNFRDRQILETLTFDHDQTSLTRVNPRGAPQHWGCNTYWVDVTMHDKGGPVPHYITLKGAGREVEIGAFLSEDERKALYADLQSALTQAKSAS
jgi:uncharacterized membrane protein